MEKEILPSPVKNGIMKALPRKLSEKNMLRLNSSGLYDFV